MSSLISSRSQLKTLLPIVLRLVAIIITLYPAVRKFTEYTYRVSQFEAYGIPWPELAVPLAGVIEIAAVVSIAFGIAGRVGAGLLGGTMVVAIGTAGPNPFSVIVLLASVGLIIIGTGPYSYWTPPVVRLVADSPLATLLDASGRWRDG